MRAMAKENRMSNRFCRTEIMLGADAMERLKNASVAVFGVGGVGGFAAEGIVRSGIGSITLVDDDVVAESNLNRHIIALTSTIGRPKVSLMAARARDINPDVMIDERIMRYDESTAESFDFTKYDYIVDAIDSVTSKLILIERAKTAGVPIISCMGAGNKLDPTKRGVSAGVCRWNLSGDSGRRRTDYYQKGNSESRGWSLQIPVR